MLTIEPILAFHDNYIWMISHPESKKVIIVDPGESENVLAVLRKRQLSLAAILITHHHYDHTNGIATILKNFPAPVYGPLRDVVPLCSHKLKEGDVITFPELSATFSVLDIPGHTLGHIAFVGEGVLFCGDTLFTAGCGRLFEGSVKQIVDSLAKLSSLPDDTNIYCGHEYTAANLAFAQTIEPDNPAILQRIADTNAKRAQGLPTVPASIALEKQTNPFLRCHIEKVITAAEKHCNQSLSDSVAVFAEIRQWKNHF